MSNIVHTGAIDYDDTALALIKRTFAKGTTDDEFALFLQTCTRHGLDPFARQAYCVSRYDRRLKVNVAQTQISIDGFRVIAERSGQYEGQTHPEWCGEDGMWRSVWLSASEPPAAARVGVYRKGWREPLYAVARWGAYVQTTKEEGVTYMWATKGDIMLSKCAEALALRKAFPHDLSGIYSPDEMGQADNPDTAPIGAPLASYALGDEERGRAERQNENKPERDEAKAIAAGWVNAFRAMTHVDEVVAWLPDVIPTWDVSDKRHRGRVYKACQAHVASGMVEGLSEVGFVEAWGHHVAIARGALNGDEQS